MSMKSFIKYAGPLQESVLCKWELLALVNHPQAMETGTFFSSLDPKLWDTFLGHMEKLRPADLISYTSYA